jgi:hypothetical protein
MRLLAKKQNKEKHDMMESL